MAFGDDGVELETGGVVVDPLTDEDEWDIQTLTSPNDHVGSGLSLIELAEVRDGLPVKRAAIDDSNARGFYAV